MVEELDEAALGRMPLPAADGLDKEGRGRILVVGGSTEAPGAAALAGLAALRAGAGKLRLAVPSPVAIPLAISLPEARVMPLDPHGIEAMLGACDAGVIGPGMLEEAEARDIAGRVLGKAGPPVVLDAAALGGATSASRQIVLTPHAGEMAKLLGAEKSEVEADGAAAAAEISARYGVVVILKGPESFIASPDGALYRYQDGVFGLATSGSGDVLAGMVGGLLARGASPLQASCWAVVVHGRAGERLSRRIGPLGFIAREILEEIPAAMAGVG